jgi:hypothetical protein
MRDLKWNTALMVPTQSTPLAWIVNNTRTAARLVSHLILVWLGVVLSSTGAYAACSGSGTSWSFPAGPTSSEINPTLGSHRLLH